MRNGEKRWETVSGHQVVTKRSKKWSPRGHQVLTKWSPSGHQVVTKWSPSGHQVITKLSTSGHKVITKSNNSFPKILPTFVIKMSRVAMSDFLPFLFRRASLSWRFQRSRFCRRSDSASPRSQPRSPRFSPVSPPVLLGAVGSPPLVVSRPAGGRGMKREERDAAGFSQFSDVCRDICCRREGGLSRY